LASFWGGMLLLLLDVLVLVVEVVLDWRLGKGREERRKVGKGDDGEGMLIGGMVVRCCFGWRDATMCSWFGGSEKSSK